MQQVADDIWNWLNISANNNSLLTGHLNWCAFPFPLTTNHYGLWNGFPLCAHSPLPPKTRWKFSQTVLVVIAHNYTQAANAHTCREQYIFTQYYINCARREMHAQQPLTLICNIFITFPYRAYPYMSMCECADRCMCVCVCVGGECLAGWLLHKVPIKMS